MCGIVGYIGKNKKAKNAVIKGLERLEYRGYDSAGIAYVNDNEVVMQKEKGRIKNLKDGINFDEKSNIAIGHTRWATHGEPNKKNSHPHKSGKITIVHNGIIENYIELRKKLESLGYEFKSDTDTETASALLDYLYKETGNMVSEATIIGMFLDSHNLYAVVAFFGDTWKNLFLKFLIATDLFLLLRHTDMAFIYQ